MAKGEGGREAIEGLPLIEGNRCGEDCREEAEMAGEGNGEAKAPAEAALEDGNAVMWYVRGEEPGEGSMPGGAPYGGPGVRAVVGGEA